MNAAHRLWHRYPRVIQVHRRKVRPGPEHRLLRAALDTGYFFRFNLPAVFFHEPELPTGLPDMVAVYLPKNRPAIVPRRCRLSPPHARLLHGLHSLSAATFSDASSLLRVERSKLTRLVDDLCESGLISVRRDRLLPEKLSRTFAVRHIVAIEAKISDWARALEQAAANRWFASQSFILIPPRRSLATVSARAQQLGVGVLVLDGDKVRQAVKPRRLAIPASYGSWLFNDWALRRHRVTS
jgi:hypothetical protein